MSTFFTVLLLYSSIRSFSDPTTISGNVLSNRLPIHLLLPSVPSTFFFTKILYYYKMDFMFFSDHLTILLHCVYVIVSWFALLRRMKRKHFLIIELIRDRDPKNHQDLSIYKICYPNFFLILSLSESKSDIFLDVIFSFFAFKRLFSISQTLYYIQISLETVSAFFVFSKYTAILCNPLKKSLHSLFISDTYSLHFILFSALFSSMYDNSVKVNSIHNKIKTRWPLNYFIYFNIIYLIFNYTLY